METEANISITQKELPSGNFQVKFFIEDDKRPMYGYLLTNEPKPVGEIISEIQERMYRRKIRSSMNPLSLKQPEKEDHNFYLYSA